MFKRILFILFLAPVALQSKAQTVTSPYSIMGIGDIESKDYGKFFGMSSTGTALRNSGFINLSNPASLPSLESNMLNIDFNVRWRSSQFKYPQYDTFSSSYSDAQLERMSITFRPSKGWGLSFGLKPYSSVNYNIAKQLSIAGSGSTNVYKSVLGSGGIDQVYIANGFQLNKNFSVGLTSSFLFGNIKTATTYSYTDLGSSIVRNEYKSLYGFQFQGGMQYTGKITSKIQQTFGATVSNPLTLSGTYEMDYVSSDTTYNNAKSSSDEKFKLPLQVSAGYSLVFSNVLTLALDYRYANWAKTKLDVNNSYTTQSQRFAFGFQYAPVVNAGTVLREKYFVQAGVAYEQGYLLINNNQVNDMSATAGVGANLNRLINLYLGLEVGSKGSNSKNQIREQYTQVSFGVTLKEFWFNTKKLRRYN